MLSQLLLAFQSTPSRRGRRQGVTYEIEFASFNPLPHAEGDEIKKFIDDHNFVSIHSLTQRETYYSYNRDMEWLFQSTPSRRGRQLNHDINHNDGSFQSTPSRRGRHIQL